MTWTFSQSHRLNNNNIDIKLFCGTRFMNPNTENIYAKDYQELH